MPRQLPPTDLDALVEQIRAHPQGLDLEALRAANPAIPRRSLQRRVAALVAAGRLLPLGQGRARRYTAAVAPTPVAAELTGGARIDATLERRSAAGVEIERYVNRPLARREPVGYQRELLDAYEPNRTSYLREVERSHLHEIGRSPAGERPAGTFARQILDRLLIDLAWASSHLEGNTYTRLETQSLIEFGRLAEGKDRLEAQMILNHKAAIELLVEDAEHIGFNRYTIQNLHAVLADNLLLDPGAGGRLRTIPVQISGTVYLPTAIPQLIAEMFDLLLAKADAIGDPFEQAFFAMVHLPYLQPFEDVNKRVSRLAANIPLVRANLAPLSFVDVPVRSYVDAVLGVYELRRVDLLRDVFVWAYERSCRRYTLLRESLPEPDPLRLKYRTLLGQVVGDIVLRRAPIEPALVREIVGDNVEPADLPAFIPMVLAELDGLHEGNIARYRLQPSEFRAWRNALESR